MNSNLQMDAQLKTVLVVTAGLGIVSALISLVYFKSTPIVLGVLSGCVLGLLNFVFLIKIVVKLFDQNYKSKSVIAVFFLLKLLVVTVVLWLSFWYTSVDKMAFAEGYLCLIVSITLVQVMGTQTSY
ncbi:MAG: hypothetical protein HQM16_12895 [Deltaproteobacteria bacterium]|nr:hypothetical protein [Deltaproteobacteria bacterium]